MGEKRTGWGGHLGVERRQGQSSERGHHCGLFQMSLARDGATALLTQTRNKLEISSSPDNDRA